MESLIFEVKLMLENNDASAAFWLGNLKHRNLAGEEISSQLPVISDDEQDEDVVDEIESMSENGETSYQRTKKADGKNPKKRTRAATPKKKKMAKATSAADVGGKKTKATSTADKKVTASKKRKQVERDAEPESARIHTMSQITNSDMSGDDEVMEPVRSALQDNEAEDDDDEGILPVRRKAPKKRATREKSIDLEGEDIDETDTVVPPARRKLIKKRPILREESIDLEDEDDVDEDEEENEEEEDEEEEDDSEDEDEYADRMLQELDERAERRRRIRNPYIDDYADQNDDEEVYSDDEEEEDDDESEDEEEGDSC